MRRGREYEARITARVHNNNSNSSSRRRRRQRRLVSIGRMKPRIPRYFLLHQSTRLFRDGRVPSFSVAFSPFFSLSPPLFSLSLSFPLYFLLPAFSFPAFSLERERRAYAPPRKTPRLIFVDSFPSDSVFFLGIRLFPSLPLVLSRVFHRRTGEREMKRHTHTHHLPRPRRLIRLRICDVRRVALGRAALP